MYYYVFHNLYIYIYIIQNSHKPYATSNVFFITYTALPTLQANIPRRYKTCVKQRITITIKRKFVKHHLFPSKLRFHATKCSNFKIMA